MALSILSARAPHLLIGVLAILASTGCANRLQERQLLPPTDPQAQACLASCELSRTQCDGRQRARETECRTQYERLTADLDACLATPGALCLRPDSCVGADMSICTIQYEECVVGCGGTVETRFSITGAPST
jgi:hypothetical protein